MNDEHTRLIEQAKAVLDGNWLGGFTKPAPGLYPHQWSWDSAFIAIGYARYDQARAEAELRALFAGQWSSGLLPQIVFSPQGTDYFPGPDVWRIGDDPRAPRAPQTTGIVQPPVHATAALHIYRYAADHERALAADHQQPGPSRQRRAERGEHEWRRLGHRLLEREPGAEGAEIEDPVHLEGIEAVERDENAEEDERGEESSG